MASIDVLIVLRWQDFVSFLHFQISERTADVRNTRGSWCWPTSTYNIDGPPALEKYRLENTYFNKFVYLDNAEWILRRPKIIKRITEYLNILEWALYSSSYGGLASLHPTEGTFQNHDFYCRSYNSYYKTNRTNFLGGPS